ASLFRVARNHVLLSRPLRGNAALDAAAIVRALGAGRSWVGLDALAPADAFSFTAVEPAEHPAPPWSMGDVVPPEPGLRLRAGVRTIDSFDGATSFHPEFDPSSSMATDVIARGAGPDGSAAARMEFRLGTPGAGRPYVWCALVSREPRDLTGAQGLVFSVRGDG